MTRLGEEERGKRPKPTHRRRRQERERPLTLGAPFSPKQNFFRRDRAAKKTRDPQKTNRVKKKHSICTCAHLSDDELRIGWVDNLPALGLRPEGLLLARPDADARRVWDHAEFGTATSTCQKTTNAHFTPASSEQKEPSERVYVCVLVQRPRAPRLTAFLHALPSTRTM